MNPSYQGYSNNPYAAPREPQLDPWGGLQGVGARPLGSGAPFLRWIILASYIGAIVFLAVGIGLQQPDGDESIQMVAVGLTIGGALCAMTYLVLFLVWIGVSWGMLPPEARMNRAGKVITPGAAIGFLFVPFYNYYWVFVQSIGLCEALDRQLAAFGSRARAPRSLAIVASIVQIIPYLNLLVAPLLWLPYAFLVDAAKAEYRRAALATG